MKHRIRPIPETTAAILLLTFLLALNAQTARAEFTWQSQVLESGFMGSIADASYDSSGVLHIAAGSGSGEALHGEWNGTSIQWDTLLTDNPRNMNMQHSAAGDVAILTTAGGTLYFSRRSGSTWSTVQVDTATYTETSLGLDSQGLGHVVYSADQLGWDNGYYCRENPAEDWTCTQLLSGGPRILSPTALAVGSGDTVHAVMYLGTDHLVKATLPLPVAWDTIQTFFNANSSPFEMRVHTDGTLRLFTGIWEGNGIDCADADVKIYQRAGGSWTNTGVSGPGEWPMDRYPRGFDFDASGNPHALFENFLFDTFCDPCALECDFGLPSGMPICASACSTVSMLRYSRFVDSVWIEEVIPKSVTFRAALLDVDTNGTPRILGKEGNDIVMLTRDLPTGITGFSDQRSANGLRVLVSPNPSARAFSFALSSGAGLESIEIFDIRGRRVRTISSHAEASSLKANALFWEGTDSSDRPVAKGVYFARFEFGDRTETHKLTVIR